MDAGRILGTAAAALLIGLGAHAVDITVKPGTFTIEQALQKAREERRLNNAKNICIRLSEGTYRLCQPVIIRPEDNGTRIVADGNVTLSGGVRIAGWRKEGKVYVSDVPEFNGRPLDFRQLYVTGGKP